MPDAACDGHYDLMFGPEGERERERKIREARAVQLCTTCPIRIPCAEIAIAEGHEFGVWAGMGEGHPSRRAPRAWNPSIRARYRQETTT